MNDFWNWFVAHSEPLTMLDDLASGQRTALLDALQRQLTAYCDGLVAEVGDATPNGRTLTISADGDIDHFAAVADLVEQAPVVDWWDVVAFRQPQKPPLTVCFDRYRFPTDRMYFIPLERADDPDQVGVRVSLPPNLPHDADPDDVEVGVYVTLEALLGEFNTATRLAYFDTVPHFHSQQEARKQGYQPLDKLPTLLNR